MSAQESTIAVLQQQLHSANVQRFERIEKTQEDQGKLLQQILANTSGLQDLKGTVEEMETERNKVKGAAKIAMWLAGTGLLSEGGKALWDFLHK